MDELIFFGGEVKALGDGKVGGYLIRHSTENDPDMVDDFFDAETNIQLPDTLPVLYQHGMDAKIGKRVIGKGKSGRDDVGVWIESQLDLRDKYERAVYALAEKGKLGWSSGALSHLVEREQVGKSYHIKTWFVGEASLTPTPAEPRNGVLPLKSLITPDVAVQADEKDTTQTVIQTEDNMNEDIKTAVEEAVKGAVKDIAEATAEQATKAIDEKVQSKLDEFKAALPEVKAGYHVEVVEDEADKAAKENPFKSVGEFFLAVKSQAEYGQTDERLLPLKATGLNEAIGSQGGFLVPETVAAGVFERMYNTGQLLSLVQRDPVSGNSMLINAVDETSRADGSRDGGITTYWVEEAGTITSSKPKFRQISLKLKKAVALAYATDELLEDSQFMASFLGRKVPEALRFSTEDAIYNGDGVGKPLGIMNSSARVDATRVNASTVIYNDIVNMWSRRWAGANDYVWLCNQDVMPQLDLLIHNGTGSIPPRFVDYDAQGIMRMKGRPVLEVEYAQTLGTNGDIVLFSPSSYQLIDKASGVQSAASIHVAFTTAEQAFRFIYRVDGAPLWNSALTPKNGSNTQSPMVGLSTSS